MSSREHCFLFSSLLFVYSSTLVKTEQTLELAANSINVKYIVIYINIFFVYIYI